VVFRHTPAPAAQAVSPDLPHLHLHPIRLANCAFGAVQVGQVQQITAPGPPVPAPQVQQSGAQVSRGDVPRPRGGGPSRDACLSLVPACPDDLSGSKGWQSLPGRVLAVADRAGWGRWDKLGAADCVSARALRQELCSWVSLWADLHLPLELFHSCFNRRKKMAAIEGFQQTITLNLLFDRILELGKHQVNSGSV
jgi:hypothetical protein